MLLTNPEQYNFFKWENILKNGKGAFLNAIDDVLKTGDIDNVIAILKSTGISINLYNNNRQRKVFYEIIDHISINLDEMDLKKIDEFKEEIYILEEEFKEFEKTREGYFRKQETIENKYKVVSYLISLEMFLKKLRAHPNKEHFDESIQRKKINMYDAAIESTGMILKYFLFNKFEFEGGTRNISPKILKVSEAHIYFSEIWNQFNDILEYWKYSKVTVSQKFNCEKKMFEIKDKDFELNILVSNERFNNLRLGWQMEGVGKASKMINNIPDIESFMFEENCKQEYSFARLYFGSTLLDEKINNITLKRWIESYQLLKKESLKFLKKQKTIKTYNLANICVCKTNYEWKKFFRQNGYSEEETEIIIQFFTFDNKSLDLVDCPFIKIDDKLVIIPSLTVNADSSRALSSNFLNRNINLDFKGKGFENRSKEVLDLNNIINDSVYKKTDSTEYECDLAFVVDGDLFFVECKAHVQPYTVRQHTNHLFKLYQETNQINRIADFFTSNLSIVIEQLKLDKTFVPQNVHKILLTTSMIGAPLFVNGVYIIDESAFTMFINRTPPEVKYIDGSNFTKFYTREFDVYNGDITSNNIIDFLKNPPQIKSTKEFFKQNIQDSGLFEIVKHTQIKHTLRIFK